MRLVTARLCWLIHLINTDPYVLSAIMSRFPEEDTEALGTWPKKAGGPHGPHFIAGCPEAIPHTKNKCQPPWKASHEGEILVTSAEKTIELSESCQERDLLHHSPQASGIRTRKQDKPLRTVGLMVQEALTPFKPERERGRGRGGGGRWARLSGSPPSTRSGWKRERMPLWLRSVWLIIYERSRH